jgi:putative SOS response-associated peptidase YedK
MFLPKMAADELPFDDPPRYNIAPTQSILCIAREAAGRPLRVWRVRWGLIPPWADDLDIGNRMINARGETIDSKPSFRQAFAARRCLIPADGYFEWLKSATGKQPYLIEAADGGMLALAGLWEENRRIAQDGTPIRSCTIVTTSANEATRWLHDRMPVIIARRDHDLWLDPGAGDAALLRRLMAAAPDELLRMTPVSRHVNNAKHDDPRCVEPLPAA